MIQEKRAHHALRDFICWRKRPKDTSLTMRAYHVLRRIADYKCLTVDQLGKNNFLFVKLHQ